MELLDNYLDEFNKKQFSQNGEDGVIEHIFNNIGFASKIFIEFGFDFKENNSRALVENHGFSGLFVDGREYQCELVNKEYRGSSVFAHNAFLTAENINSVISNYFEGEIDFLSIDVDGVDLHLFDSINVVEPRVVCIEYCSSIGKEMSVTVPYKEDFDRLKEHQSGMFCNGSLLATIRVLRKRCYRFVGTVYGLNAFFVRNDCELNDLREQNIDHWQPHRHRTEVRKISQIDQFGAICDADWIPVSDKGIIGQK